MDPCSESWWNLVCVEEPLSISHPLPQFVGTMGAGGFQYPKAPSEKIFQVQRCITGWLRCPQPTVEGTAIIPRGVKIIPSKYRTSVDLA